MMEIANPVESLNSTKTHYLSRLWILDSALNYNGGWVQPKKADRIIDLARHTGLLLKSSYQLSDEGFVLRCLLDDKEKQPELEQFNPLDINIRPSLSLLYLRLVLKKDRLLPIFLKQSVIGIRTRSGKDDNSFSTLRRTAYEFESQYSEDLDLTELGERKKLSDLLRRISKIKSTEENYSRPRFELLTDVGLLSRTQEGEKGGSKSAWVTNETTLRAQTAWNDIINDPTSMPDYLSRKFFGSMNDVFEKGYSPVSIPEERLAFASVGYNAVGREMGFTFVDSIALYACLIAWEKGKIMEIDEAIDAMKSSSTKSWSEWISYSGGTRLDDKFMVKFKGGFTHELVKYLESKGIDFPKHLIN